MVEIYDCDISRKSPRESRQRTATVGQVIVHSDPLFATAPTTVAYASIDQVLRKPPLEWKQIWSAWVVSEPALSSPPPSSVATSFMILPIAVWPNRRDLMMMMMMLRITKRLFLSSTRTAIASFWIGNAHSRLPYCLADWLVYGSFKVVWIYDISDKIFITNISILECH